MTNIKEVTHREVNEIETDLQAMECLKNDLYKKTVGLKAAIYLHIPMVCEGDRRPKAETLASLVHGNEFIREYKDGEFVLDTDKVGFKQEHDTARDVWLRSIMDKYTTADALKEQHDRIVVEYKTSKVRLASLETELDKAKHAKEYALGHILEDLYNEDTGNGQDDKEYGDRVSHRLGNTSKLDTVVEHIKTGQSDTCIW